MRAAGEPARGSVLPPLGPPDVEKVNAAAQEYWVEVLGPPPGAHASSLWRLGLRRYTLARWVVIPVYLATGARCALEDNVEALGARKRGRRSSMKESGPR